MSDTQTRRAQLSTVRRVSPQEAQAMLQSGRAVIVDAREHALYEEMHAQGAINIPLAEIESSSSLSQLEGISEEQAIIFYCT